MNVHPTPEARKAPRCRVRLQAVAATAGVATLALLAPHSGTAIHLVGAGPVDFFGSVVGAALAGGSVAFGFWLDTLAARQRRAVKPAGDQLLKSDPHQMSCRI